MSYVFFILLFHYYWTINSIYLLIFCIWWDIILILFFSLLAQFPLVISFLNIFKIFDFMFWSNMSNPWSSSEVFYWLLFFLSGLWPILAWFFEYLTIFVQKQQQKIVGPFTPFTLVLNHATVYWKLSGLYSTIHQLILWKLLPISL